MTRKKPIVSVQVESQIYLIRGHKVMFDSDLAGLYGVEVKALNQAIKRNKERFPGDFMFQLTPDETVRLRSQIVTLKPTGRSAVGDLRSQPPVSNRGSGRHRKYRPYVFTEQGVAMLSSVLRSKRAILVNVEIMRAFVRLRQLLASNVELARKLAALEKKYDVQFKAVFDAIRELMAPTVPKRRPIGFATWEDEKPGQ